MKNDDLTHNLVLGGCSSVEIVRLQPDLLQTPKGTEPLAAIQVTTMGFFLMTLGLPEADLDRAVNELLLKEAKKLGADRVINLRFDVTPSHGIWYLTKLLWFRVATAWGIAVVSKAVAEDVDLWADQGPNDQGPNDQGPNDQGPKKKPVHPVPAPASQPAASRPTPGAPGTAPPGR